jgi:hypothetical protein
VGVTGATGRAGSTGATGPSLGGHATATASAGTATLNSPGGIITSESLTSATSYTLTLVNSSVVASSNIIAVAHTETFLAATVVGITPNNGSMAISVLFGSAYTGTVKINFTVS